MAVGIVAGVGALASDKRVQSAVKKAVGGTVEKIASKVLSGRYTDNSLIRNRDKLFNEFKKLGIAYSGGGLFEKYRIEHSDIKNQKWNEDYSAEWGRLYDWVCAVFERHTVDMMVAFKRVIPRYTPTGAQINNTISFAKAYLSGGPIPTPVETSSVADKTSSSGSFLDDLLAGVGSNPFEPGKTRVPLETKEAAGPASSQSMMVMMVLAVLLFMFMKK